MNECKFHSVKKNKKILGFTLIELLIVIVILGILSVIGLGSFTAAQTKSRDSKRKSSLNAIVTSLEVYYNDFGSYPNDDGNGKIMGCGPGGVAATACSFGSQWSTDNGTMYMVQLPVDPSVNDFYYISNAGKDFQIYARLENVHDRDVPEVSGEPGVYVEVNDECGGDGCNYGVSSSNITLGGNSGTEKDQP